MAKNEKAWQFTELEIYKALYASQRLIIDFSLRIKFYEHNIRSETKQVKEYEKRLKELKAKKKK